MKLIVGLGNPGKKYQKTRHNVGFMTIDFLKHETCNLKLGRHNLEDMTWNKKFNTEILQTTYKLQATSYKLVIAKPMTYMNNSGEPIAKLSRFYKIKPKDIWVIYDDIALPVGTLRIRQAGSSGGHNGVESIIQHLGTNQFPRFRIGIGPLPTATDPAAFVLQKFSQEEELIIKRTIKTATDAVIFALENNLEKTMSKFNKN
jgi:PTH1 family peptidyl-tRNA hydrolase